MIDLKLSLHLWVLPGSAAWLQSPVGAGLLAKAAGQETWMLDLPAPSRASPLPQVQWLYAKSANYSNHCGSGLARESGVSGEVDAGCAGLIASKLAPTGLVAVRKICELLKSLWESLLTMAECQAKWMLDVPASSRASPLPQVL